MGGSFRDERANMMEITKLKKTRLNYCRDVFLYRHNRLENNTKIFSESFGEIILVSVSILQSGL